ncbi:MAG TPA: alpha/beta hydrolase, partial [Trebonia sp.]
LPGTMCSPAVFGPLGESLAGQVTVDPFSWLTEPGPWDIPAVAERVARHISQNYARPVLVCGHSTGGAIALQLAASRPETVLGLVLADTGAHMRGHGDVDAILDRIRASWGEELRAAVLDRSFHIPLSPQARAGFLAWAAPLSQQAVYDVLASQRDLDLTPGLAGITQPAVVVHGRHDRAQAPVVPQPRPPLPALVGRDPAPVAGDGRLTDHQHRLRVSFPEPAMPATVARNKDRVRIACHARPLSAHDHGAGYSSGCIWMVWSRRGRTPTALTRVPEISSAADKANRGD